MKTILVIASLFSSFAVAVEGMVGTCNVSCLEVKAKTYYDNEYEAFRNRCESQFSGTVVTNAALGGYLCTAHATRTFSGIVGYGECRAPVTMRRYLQSCIEAAESWVYGKNIGDCDANKHHEIGDFECKSLEP